MSPRLANDLNALDRMTRDVLARGGRMWVGGRECEADSGQTLAVVDPSSGETISSIPRGSAGDVDRAVKAARGAFESDAWSGMAPLAREALLHRLADLMQEHASTLAQLETVDVGQPIWLASDLNVGGAIASLRYFAGWASKIHGETVPVAVPIPESRFFGYTTQMPVGVVGAIIPWNVPVMLAIWKLAPAIAAGCTIVLKPSEEASMAVQFLGGLAQRAGFPPGVINVVTGTGSEAGAALAAHPGVAKVTFTGSTATGRAIARAAADGIRKVSLELGGKSPQILCADADLDQAISGAANAIFLNSGQVCVAGSRLYVHRAIHDRVVEQLASFADSLRVGPGLDPASQIGPLVSGRQKERVEGFLRSHGGQTATRRPTPDVPGYYVAPTVIARVKQTSSIVQEEIFGPVLAVMPFDDIEQAVQLANDSEYGLSACVWTRDISTAHHLAAGIRSGKVAINTEPLPYPGLPEGGTKASGYGRDLGRTSVESYCESKSVLIRYR